MTKVGRKAPPGSRLVSIAAARSATRVSGAALGAPFAKDAGWIEARTGIRELGRLSSAQDIAEIAVEAGRVALLRARLTEPIDLVITASCSTPGEPGGTGGGQAIGARLAPHAPWFEINSACSGFSYALAAADAHIRAGDAKHVLIIAAEHMSRLIDPADLGTSIIFGDGAGAAVIAASSRGTGIGPVVWGSDGAQSTLIACEERRGRLRMDGPQVFRWAVESVPPLALEACRRAGVRVDDIDVFVPHQANVRIIDSIARKLGLHRAVVATDIRTAGNTSAASIPMALARLAERGLTRAGQLALVVGFGAGLAYAGQVIELPAL
jgi:3-oxoacyl-[acyl-carrier-protein] synthase III